MKQKKWSPLQIKKALSLSEEINSSIKGISINSKTLKKNKELIESTVKLFGDQAIDTITESLHKTPRTFKAS